MINKTKKISICLIIILTAVISTGCEKFNNTVSIKTESKFDSLTNRSKKTKQSYVNNVVYLGEAPRKSKKLGPGEVSFDFYDLKR